MAIIDNKVRKNVLLHLNVVKITQANFTINKRDELFLINRVVADDVVEQSKQVLGVIASEGVAIIPLDVAYAIVGNSKKSIETIFKL